MRRVRVWAALGFATVAGLGSAPAAPAITGGQLASEPYPHMAAMEHGGDFVCGASVVAPDWVLSAAHCVLSNRPSDFVFVIGTSNLNSGGERIAATQIVRHEEYGKPEADSHDVALFKLARPTSLGRPIALADPATERSFWEPGDPARVIGFGGQAYPGLVIDGRLREVDVPIVSDSECARSYNLTIGGFESTTMVCAGELYGVKDSCQGDSGGPLMVRNAASAWVQVGVVSWGFGCGYPTQYGVYSRVGDRKLGDWIRARVGGQPLTPGAIAGRVTEHKTRTALASATVSCGSAGSAVTGTDGRYSITGVQPGSYSCTASKSGYASKSSNVTVSSGATSTADFALRRQ